MIVHSGQISLRAVILFLFCIVQCLSQYSTTLILTSAPTNQVWFASATSESGQFIAAVSESNVYTSSDYGYNWKKTNASSPSSFVDIACSSSGNFLVVVAVLGYIYTSNDYGVKWNKTSAPDEEWASVAASSTGQYLYAVTENQYLYSSSNFGGTWSSGAKDKATWTAVACSSTGQIVAATIANGNIVISNNYGTSYNTTAFKADWVVITMSNTGQYVAAAINNGGIALSTDFGVKWSITTAPLSMWSGIAATTTGQYMYAVYEEGGMYYSDTYGSSWIHTNTSVQVWQDVSTSGDGQYLTGVVQEVGVFTTFYSPSSQPSCQPTNSPSRWPTRQPTSSPSVYQQYSSTLVEMNDEPLQYNSITSSANGQYLYATTDSQGVYMSHDFGNSFSQYASYLAYTDVACSSSGQIVYLISDGAAISTNYGSTWSTLSGAPVAQYSSIATSGSGQFVYITYATGNNLVYSSNYGKNFTQYTDAKGNLGWAAIKCSENGQYVSAAPFNKAGMFYSSDYGVSFLESTVVEDWNDLTMSSSGQYQAATCFGNLYLSSNYGVSWTASSAPKIEWIAVTSDSTGQYLYAIGVTSVYASLNYGQTWFVTESPEIQWVALTLSSNGEYLAAVAYEQGFYTNHYSIPTSEPSSQPSNQPNAVPTVIPSSQPTSLPSLQPHTSFPSSQPSVCPSSQPSTQPSVYPTFVPDTFTEKAVVTATGATSSYVFNNLGCQSPAFLTVTILVSYLDASSSGYISITAGKSSNIMVAVENCAPAILCGSVVCAVNVNVSSAVSCEGGGSLTLFATTVNSSQQSGVDTLCTYQGTPGLQYAVSYSLSAHQLPTAAPTVAPTLAGNGNFVFEASPNTPFYIIVLFTLLFTALGVFLVRLRDKSGYSDEKLTTTCIDLGMNGYHLTSEVFYIVLLFSEDLDGIAAAIIVIRLCSFIPAIYFMLLSTGPTTYSSHYERMLDKAHMFKNASIYSLITLLMLFEQSFIRYYPWKESDYTRQSRGFPDPHFFKICMTSKLSQLVSALIFQVIVIAHSDAYLFNGDNASDTISLVLVLLYLVSSVLTVVMLGITCAIRLKAGKSDVTKVDNPLHTAKTETEMMELNKGALNSKTDKEIIAYLLDREVKLSEREKLLSLRLDEVEAQLQNLKASK